MSSSSCNLTEPNIAALRLFNSDLDSSTASTYFLQWTCSNHPSPERVVLQLAPWFAGHPFGSESSCAAFSSLEFLPTIYARLRFYLGHPRTRDYWRKITAPALPVLLAARHSLKLVQHIFSLAWRPADDSEHHVFHSCAFGIRHPGNVATNNPSIWLVPEPFAPATPASFRRDATRDNPLCRSPCSLLRII